MRLLFCTLGLLMLNAHAVAKVAGAFVKNMRQWPQVVKFKADVPGGSMYLTNNSFIYSFRDQRDIDALHELRVHGKETNAATIKAHVYEVKFVGGNTSAFITGEEKQSYYHNYFLGRDTSKWATDVPVYGAARYKNLYRSIDLSIYSAEGLMKYDFIVKRGGDPSKIRMQFEGVKPVINEAGEIVIVTTVNEVREQAPIAYQIIDGVKKQISCAYRFIDEQTIGFSFPQGFEEGVELVIDPTLVFSTYSGATADNWGACATYDAQGHLYATSQVSGGWIITPGAYQSTGGNLFSMGDIGINKYTNSGSALIWAAFIGGADSEEVIKMTTNSQGELVMLGATASTDYPVTAGCYDNSLGGTSDFFLTKLNASGSALIGSTLLGGSSFDGTGWGDVMEDAQGNVWCASTTTSTDFPVTGGAFQPALAGGRDGVVFRMNGNFTTLQYSSFLGGSDLEWLMDMDFTTGGAMVVCGRTASTDYPVTAGSAFSAPIGLEDAFVTVIAPAGNILLASTYLGTSSHDVAYHVQVGSTGEIYVAGGTQGNYPVSTGVYSETGGGVFLHKLTPSLTSLLSTSIIPGGRPYAFLVNGCGNIHLGTFTSQYTAQTTPDALQSSPGEIYLCRLGTDFSGLSYGSYLGTYFGSGHSHGQADFDKAGNLYTTLCVQSFITTPGAFATTSPGGGHHGLSFKFHFDSIKTNASITVAGADSGCAPLAVSFVNNTWDANHFYWDFGDGDTSTQTAPTHIFQVPGTYIVRMISHNGWDCNSLDTAYWEVKVIAPDTTAFVAEKNICYPGELTLDAPLGFTFYQWQDGSTMGNLTVEDSGTYWVISAGGCQLRVDTFRVLRVNLRFDLGEELVTCLPLSLSGPQGMETYLWQGGQTTPSIPVTDGGLYWLEVRKDGCMARDTVVVEFRSNTSTVHDTLLCQGKPVDLILTAVVPEGGTALWNNNSSAASIRVTDTGTYWVTVSEYNCTYTDTTRVGYIVCDCEAVFPSAFSPDGDGFNDLFRVIVPANCRVSGYQLSVYNRWGELVYSTRDVTSGWDGRYRGQKAELGTYMYVAELELGEQRKVHRYKGDVILVK